MPQSPRPAMASSQSAFLQRREALYKGDYPKYIEYLHRLGTSLQEAWQFSGRTQESGRKEFRQYIKQIALSPDNKSLTLAELCECVSQLEVILTVWEDPGLRKEKAERQAHKVKRKIDIVDRHAIHTALFAEVASLISEIENLSDFNANAIKIRFSSAVQEIKQDFEELAVSDGKLNNAALADILKRIKLLNSTSGKVKNEKRNEELLEEILEPSNWRRNEKLIEAILHKINASKQAGNEADNEKLLSTIVEYISKKEKQNKSLIDIEKQLQKLRETKFKLGRQSPDPLIWQEIKKLEYIIEQIKKDKKDNAELLKKIYRISEDEKNKKRIKTLLGENFSITEDTFDAWVSTEEVIQKSQETLANVEAAIKSKQVREALTSFKTPADKALSRVSIFLSVLAGLACGIVTGGCIFLLIGGALPLGVAIAIGVLVFMAGFSANYNFFSYAIPELLLNLAKSGGITEFFDKDGKRAQLSTGKKLLLVPAALFSVAVGVCVCAFTIMSGMHLVAVLPFLAAPAGPALPAILIGILAVAIGVAMSIIMFRAFVGVLQKPFSFAQLWQGLVKTLRELTVIKALGYAIKGLIIAFAIFSLFFLCATGVPTLAIAFGATVAHIFGLASFVGQIPFCAVTMSNFCDFVAEWVVTKLFGERPAPSGKISQRLSVPTKQGFFSRCLSFIKQAFVPASLLTNAGGNGVLVVVPNSPITYAAAVGNTFISVAGNMVPEQTGEPPKRTKANEVIVQDIIKPPIARPANDDAHMGLSDKNSFSKSHTLFSHREEPRSAQLNEEQIFPAPAL
jgi:hypothetical protein